jgi:hypothetical protein
LRSKVEGRPNCFRIDDIGGQEARSDGGVVLGGEGSGDHVPEARSASEGIEGALCAARLDVALHDVCLVEAVVLGPTFEYRRHRTAMMGPGLHG